MKSSTKGSANTIEEWRAEVDHQTNKNWSGIIIERTPLPV
jgi:hypothetical protein